MPKPIMGKEQAQALIEATETRIFEIKQQAASHIWEEHEGKARAAMPCSTCAGLRQELDAGQDRLTKLRVKLGQEQ